MVHNIAELVRTSAAYGEIRATLTVVYRVVLGFRKAGHSREI